MSGIYDIDPSDEELLKEFDKLIKFFSDSFADTAQGTELDEIGDEYDLERNTDSNGTIESDKDYRKRIRGHLGIKDEETTIAKCECGSDVADSPAHSNWCPKH